ncbi:MAG: hypothetical protein H3C39_04205 [Flavobacteriia bacterium]|nr:hypothetical protein [Flavobacteriia bacterium]
MKGLTNLFGIVLILVFMISCNDHNSEISHQDFKFSDERNDAVIQLKSKIKIDFPAELYYNVILNKEKNDSVIESYFLFEGNKYSMPKNFHNDGKRYEYSLFPDYKSPNILVSKSYVFENFSVIIIRGENPFCNGFNCTTYYMHVLKIKDDKIDMNVVYEFDNEVEFENLDVKISNEKNTIQIMNNEMVLDELIL